MGYLGNILGMAAVAGVLALGGWLATRSLWVTAGVFAGVIAVLVYNRRLARMAEDHREKLSTLSGSEAAIETALYRVRRVEWQLVALAAVIAVAIVAVAIILDRHDSLLLRRFR
jgi:hypothetical protein